MSFNPGGDFPPLLPLISFRLGYSSSDFATNLMWPQISILNIPLSKHLIKYPLVKQIQVALGWFQEQELAMLTN